MNRSQRESFAEKGYIYEEVSVDLIDRIEKMIDASYLLALRKAGVSMKPADKIKNYGKTPLAINHKKIWEKKNRILNMSDASSIIESELGEKIRSIFGDYTISDEERLGYGNVYWRIVRPNTKEDIGPIHRDEWFWKLNPEREEECKGKDRVKCWIPIISEKGKNLLLLEEGSHRRTDIKFESEIRDGIYKPKFNNKQNKTNMSMARMVKKDIILFHDRLLHSGSLNRGNLVRISLEFTLIINKNVLQNDN